MPKTKLTLAGKVHELIAKRDELDALKAEHKKVMEPLEIAIAALTEVLKMCMKKERVTRISTDLGTSFLSVRRTPYVADETRVIAWLEGKGLAKEYVAPRLVETFYSKFLKDDATKFVTPDGVEMKEVEVFSIRRPEQKDGNRGAI